MLVVDEVLEHSVQLFEESRLVGCVRHSRALEQTANRRQNSAVILDEHLQVLVVLRSTGTNRFVQSARELLVGEVPYEDRVQLLEKRNESDDSAMGSYPIGERHQLAVLVGERLQDPIE